VPVVEAKRDTVDVVVDTPFVADQYVVV
jgi:hypothetical protein